MTDIGLSERGSGSVRMTEKGYEDFLSELSGELLALAALGRVFKKDCYPDEKTLSDSQGVLIRFGEKLEEYGFAGTTVIEHLELMCEELYQLTIHQESDVKNHLADMFCQLEEKIRDSVQITPSRLCIVAILKNEASYIREWLAYHRLVGVDRFILYDNESDDGLHELIDKLPPKYDVIYNPWPGEVVQLSAYNDALKRYRYSTDQMAFIDADEYIVPVQRERLVPDILDEIYDDYENKPYRLRVSAGGIGINWRIYGTSFHSQRVEGMVTENYLYRADDRYPENAHIKTICNPRAVDKFTWTAHIPSYRGNYAQISENGTYMVDSHVFYDARYDKLKIHHYYTKSEEEYAQKLRRGWPDQPHQSIMDERIEQELRKRDCCNDIRDDCMLYYSKDINRAISEMN